MAEAERIIGTPDTPDTDRDGQDRDQEDRDLRDRDGSEPAGADGTTEEAERPRGRRRIAVLFAVAAFAYLLDLVSKMIVVAKLEHHEPIEIVGDWLRFEAIRNAGAAFGFGEAFTVIFTVIARQMKVFNGTDDTAPEDYHADEHDKDLREIGVH